MLEVTFLSSRSDQNEGADVDRRASGPGGDPGEGNGEHDAHRTRQDRGPALAPVGVAAGNDEACGDETREPA
jgi:hypothetical protein